MADKKNEDTRKENEAREAPVGMNKADVLKILRDNKVEIIGRKGVTERDILSFVDREKDVVVITCDGRKHVFGK